MKAGHDVLIVGGGIVGAALACALGGSRLRVALIDAGEEPGEPALDDYDLRVSAITRASERMFRVLGAWEGMAARRVSPYREMYVWDAGGAGSVRFDAGDLGEVSLGHIIENRVTRAALLERLRDHDNVDCIFGVDPKNIAWQTDGLVFEHGSGRLTARLAIGADGARSWVREQLQVEVRGWDYGHTAVVATVRTGRPHRETAWQRFLPAGPLAFLPLQDQHHCSIVWSTRTDHAEELLALDDQGFGVALEHAFESRLGPVEVISPRRAFPLRMRHAERYVLERAALVGDAAHTIHPLAGQGVNLGLLDAAALAEVVLDAVAAGRDPGGLPVLRRYERWRRGENLLMIGAMEGFKRLFAAPLPPLAWIRNLGLQVTDGLPPVKAAIVRRAMGLTGDLPRLSRGRLPGTP